jgi:hypothetical protein
MRSLVFPALAAGLLAASPAIADEAWDSDAGEIIYAEDLEIHAVFLLTQADGIERRFFIRDLAGNYDDRIGWFDGYWVASNMPGKTTGDPCPFSIIAANGEAYDTWGQVAISFDSPVFPSGFTAVSGMCLEPPVEEWTASLR